MQRSGPTVAYLVSRFPATSETFVVRELNAVSAHSELELRLLSLFPPGDATVHAAAREWVERVRRPSVPGALGALAWWMLRRPLRLSGSIARVIGAYALRPGRLIRSLATIPLAASHARAVRLQGIEHVHAHFASYATLAAWLTGRLTGVPYSFTAHAHDLFVEQAMLPAFVDEAAFVATISEFNRRFLDQHDGDAETEVRVIHCGVDPAEYPFRPRSAPSAPDRVRAVCVATLEEKKGHAVLIEALELGGERLARLDIDLIGDGPLRESLERSVAEAGLSDRVRFLGRLTEDAVRDALEQADAFVLPSIVARNGQMEGIPVALMEALAVGLPVVTTRLSGIPELIRDGESGFLAEPGDPSSLAAALARVLDGSALELQAGRALIESEFNVDEEAQELVGLFKESFRSG